MSFALENQIEDLKKELQSERDKIAKIKEYATSYWVGGDMWQVMIEELSEKE